MLRRISRKSYYITRKTATCSLNTMGTSITSTIARLPSAKGPKWSPCIAQREVTIIHPHPRVPSSPRCAEWRTCVKRARLHRAAPSRCETTTTSGRQCDQAGPVAQPALALRSFLAVSLGLLLTGEEC